VTLGQTARSEQAIFDALEELCASPGYIHVLAFLSLRDNMVSYRGHMTNEDMAASYAPNRTIRTEFSTLLGLMIKHPIHFGLPTPEEMGKLIQRTSDLLAELHDCLGTPMWRATENLKRQDEGLPVDEATLFSRGDVIREPIFYGGESAYSFQYRDFALKRYDFDNTWLRDNKGFSIIEAHTVVRALADLTNRKVAATAARDHAALVAVTTLRGFTFTLEEIAEEAALTPAKAELVLAAFTVPEPPTNTDFKSLGDFNLSNACPILHSPDGGYIALQTYGAVEALYDSPFYWMVGDKAYRSSASSHRGAFTENFVAARLTGVFGAGHVHSNVNILRGNAQVTEVDILVLFGDRAVVVQCKSKKLTLEARKGNDLQLRDDFKKSVQDAYDQANRCAVSLGDAGLRFVGADGQTIDIPALREVYPVCVVSDHYPALTVQAREFLNFQADDTIQPPLVADVFLVDVLAEMLASPLRFLSYLDRRVKYGHRIHSINELAILGYHLHQNLWINPDIDMVLIDDSNAVALDTAMTVRREGIAGERTPRGILTRLEASLIGRFLTAIEHSTDKGLIELGFMLLTLSGVTLDALERGIEQIARQARQDGLSHDFTLGPTSSGMGITVHCGRLPNAVAAERLAAHCRLNKYKHRAEAWYGLVVTQDDGLPKFGLILRFPWLQDDAMDEALAAVPLTGSPVPSRRTFPKKIGRNEPCPCGSGKKFKKCCMH
jgi:hypothetical protein